ncbi:TRAP transporter small permease [Azospirillum isscasi]|uniref:TRAP transporter small permease protein n=1 Tax=Azospirillum isscasi TaxID=3053926 RepID=A0ABU0WG19_9PROT|nr:TRAP transporter small permease [Azospirillum isscasi]MDQ2103037.1 TRAP transporter small permease [Azospirillum isscasi]
MNTLLKRTELALSGLSVLAIIAIMLIVTADTFMRYVLHAPFSWSFELISYYLLIAAIHFAISDTFREGDHIGVDLLPQSIPRKLQTAMEIMWVTAAAVVFGIISWGAFDNLHYAYVDNEFIPGVVAWPVWLSYLPIATGSAVMTLRLFLHLLSLIALGADPEVLTHGDVLE